MKFVVALVVHVPQFADYPPSLRLCRSSINFKVLKSQFENIAEEVRFGSKFALQFFHFFLLFTLC